VLPDVGDGKYELWLEDGGGYSFKAGLDAGTEYFFDGPGVANFRVLGIEAGAGPRWPRPIGSEGTRGDNRRMNKQILFGFHAVGVRLKTAPASIVEIHVDATRRDARMRQLVERAIAAKARLIDSDDTRLTQLCGVPRHQGVVARVKPLPRTNSLDELLDGIDGAPLLLVLDGVTDPHNLGACLRVADGAGVHAVIAPKDHAVGLNATVAKVASGAAETVPYLMVTNLARTLNELKERDIRVVGTSDDAPATLYQAELRGPLAQVLGAEGAGLRQLTRKTCDALLRIPMAGAVESLNVSVAAGVCLYEALRQRGG
jgi:23S rRNA (guanosine2251-2'-O)-methyltransferase